MEDTDMNWRKATYSNGGENCIETANSSGAVLVRDTKDRQGPMLTFTVNAWQGFISGLK